MRSQESASGTLPALFKSEDDLRSLWSLPETRKALLGQLSELGFGRDHLTEMQKIVSAENSDIFDVLAYVAFASTPVTRDVRAAHADHEVQATLSDKQRTFIAFVLDHYVKQGVDQLDIEKLAPPQGARRGARPLGGQPRPVPRENGRKSAHAGGPHGPLGHVPQRHEPLAM